MSGKKYVPEGVYLVCDKGAKPSELRSLSSKKTTIFGENMCTKVDTKIAVNFDPFGACSCSNGNPCTAPVTGWTNVSDAITLGGNELLLENSELPCALGGKVKIFFTMAAATAAMPKPKKSFWRKAVDTIAEINQTIVDFEVGVAKGLWKGLKGTVTGVVDLVIWAGKHHPIYILANPQGYAEQLKKDKETFKAIGNALGKASKWMYRNSMANMLTNPNDYRLAQQENAIMLDKMMEKAATMNAEDWGSFLGQVLFEVGLEVATVGGAAALTAVKAADKTLDAVKVINAIDNATDAAKVLDKAEDIADGAKVLDKINDGNKIDLPPIEAKVSGNVEFVNETFESSNKILALPPPRNTSLSLKEVRRLRGRKKWEAGETYVQELYGSKGQKHYQVPAEGKITGSGGRYVDAPVSVPKNNVIAIEVKTYNKYITVEGNAILNEVPLSSSIKQQVLKDIYLRDNVPGYDPRWIFLDAPPSAELSTFLNKNRIISIIYK